MRKINPKSSDIDSFKYSVLISLHYYDISFHPERRSKLKPYEDKYSFSDTTPIEFETNNPNISLTIFDEDKKKIYTTENNSADKAKIIHLKYNIYADTIRHNIKVFFKQIIKKYILNSINSNDSHISNIWMISHFSFF